MRPGTLALFALGTTRTFAEGVAQALGTPLCEHEEREFEDGEHKSRPLVSVRGCDVFVLHSLYSDTSHSVDGKLCRLLFFIGALRDASAARITAVIPYLPYARKDRKTQPRDPVTTRYLACLIEAVGSDRVLGLEVHNLAAFQNAFRCPTDHLEADRLFLDHFLPLLGDTEQPTVVSPDVGGMKRAERFRGALTRALGRDVGVAMLEKARSQGVLRVGRLVGEVRDSVAILLDDMIVSGGTLLGAAAACRAGGARRVYAAACHGLFLPGAERLFAAEGVDSVVVTDSVPPFRLEPRLVGDKLVVLPLAPLVAEAIRRIHTGGSVTELLAS